ncbi:hypothetical protein ACTOB_003756 [Actinoplanes oblitus]|uniref:XRE family transcriptional regulator n=1 Tax=Actinoplanes oblitus TaxID=3040509 RepID=A0ABY8WQD9_9ACTN|nr:hypothetical protein [Actinoplanes oblitus]WIN00075.1 hypothetical protein ACTOB_003756 [Actinoplanes oblitus]
MGRLIAAYRSHPEHGIPISQEVVGLWAFKSQSQICKIENGKAPDNLSQLQFWARTLSIPPQLLWFSLPETRSKAEDNHRDEDHLRDSAILLPGVSTQARLHSGGNAKHSIADDTTSVPPSYVSTPSNDFEIQSNEISGRESLVHELTGLRHQLDEALAASSVSVRQIDTIEESTGNYVNDYPATPPTVMLSRIAMECAEVTALSQRRQPAAVQARLSSCAALLSTLCADALMRLGRTTDAQLWYRTAMFAADDCERPTLGVLVRAQAAMLPYYFGDARQTVQLADEALSLSAKPCGSGALAAAGRARALARIGDTAAARDAVKEARALFDQVGGDDSDAAFRFPVKRFLFYVAGAATWMGDTDTAYKLQDEALALYRGSHTVSIDPALILLDRARCLVSDNRADEAATVAIEAVAMLPERQRTEIVLARAHEIAASMPIAARRGPAVDLSDYVRECRRRARTLAGGRTALNG